MSVSRNKRRCAVKRNSKSGGEREQTLKHKTARRKYVVKNETRQVIVGRGVKRKHEEEDKGEFEPKRSRTNAKNLIDVAEIKRGYTSLNGPGAFAGADQYARASGVKRKHIENVLEEVAAHMLHKPKLRRFERRQVYVSGPGEIFEMDLADLGKKRSRNNLKQKYILVIIDKFSRKTWLESLSGKTAPKVAAGILKILKRCGYRPWAIHSDFGREFYNGVVEKLLKDWGIKLYSTTTAMKATMAERVIRTIFGKIARYLTHNNTTRFVDKLRYFENLYNNSHHSSIGMTPNEVNDDTKELVYHRLYRSKVPPLYKTPKFKIGDSVLAVTSKGLFDKGYAANYSKDPYTIVKVLHSPPQHYLCKRGGKVNFFYETELIKNRLTD
jgi:integrase-like protein